MQNDQVRPFTIPALLVKASFLLTNVPLLSSQGQVVDLYVPRKCSATNRLITAKDHASVQINVAEVDEGGKLTGANVTYAFHGGLRETGDSDDALNRFVFLWWFLVVGRSTKPCSSFLDSQLVMDVS